MRQVPMPAVRTLIDIQVDILLDADAICSLLRLRTRLVHNFGGCGTPLRREVMHISPPRINSRYKRSLPRMRKASCNVWCGGVLLSRILPDGVSSPCPGLASRFGMGTGRSPGAMAAANSSTIRGCGCSATGERTRFHDLESFQSMRCRPLAPVSSAGRRFASAA